MRNPFVSVGHSTIAVDFHAHSAVLMAVDSGISGTIGIDLSNPFHSYLIERKEN